MDVVARLFSLLPAKKASPKDAGVYDRRAKYLIAQEGWEPPRINGDMVRLVLFRDQEGRCKQPVFDSKLQNGTTDNADNTPSYSASSMSQSLRQDGEASLTRSFSNSSKHRPPLVKRPSSDAELLGEMMFGSMPMKLSGSSLKIHYIRSENQLMLTKVFHAQKRMMSSCSLELDTSCQLSCDTIERGVIPQQQQKGYVCSLRPSPSPDSGPRYHSNSFTHLSPCPSPSGSLPVSLTASFNNNFNYDCSPTQSLTPNTGLPLSANNLSSSLTRRLQRARSTSLENGSELYHRVLKPMDQQTAAGSGRRGRKYAIGIIFTLTNMSPNDKQMFQEFFFSHFTLIATNFEQLREKVEESLWCNRQSQPDMITKAYHMFVEDIMAFYCAQKIKAPVWLSIINTSNGGRRDICKRFLIEFTSAVAQLDTKEKKFFFSSLLTAVLSQHIAWVYTASKSGSTTSRHHEKMTSKSLAVIAQRNPYNPLWAQLGDLYGAVSDPLVVCRTIVTGKSSTTVSRLLYLLSYFIRCSEVEQDGLFRNLDDTGGDLEGSEMFPHESRAGSTVTITSEGGRGPSEKDSFVIKPHPFNYSYSRASSLSRPSSRCDSVNDDGRVFGSLDILRGNAESGHHTPMYSQSKSHNSPDMCSSVPARLSKTPRASPATKRFNDFTSPFSSLTNTSNAFNIPVSSSLQESPCPSPSSYSPQNQLGSFSLKESVATFPDRDCSPSELSDIVTDGVEYSKPSHMECHFQLKPDSCSTDPRLDSMGMCPIDNQMVYWRPTRSCQQRSVVSPPPPASSGSEDSGYPFYDNQYTDAKSESKLPSTTCNTGSVSIGFPVPGNNSVGGVCPTYTTIKAPPKRGQTCISIDSGRGTDVTDSGQFTENDSIQSSPFSCVNSSISLKNKSLSKPSALPNINPECSLRPMGPISTTGQSTYATSAGISNAYCVATDNSMPSTLHTRSTSPTNCDRRRLRRGSHDLPAISHDTRNIYTSSTCQEDPDILSMSYDNTSCTGRSSSLSPKPHPLPSFKYQTPHDQTRVNIPRGRSWTSSQVKKSPSLLTKSSNMKSSSSMISLPSISITSSTLSRNSSYKGLPVSDGVCPDLEDNDPQDEGLRLLKLDAIDVQESLSPTSLSALGTFPPSTIETGKMRFAKQFESFTTIEIDNIEDDFTLDTSSPLSPPPVTQPIRPSSRPPSQASQVPHMPPNLPQSQTTPTQLSDFGHSLMGGYSDKYLPHYVLHGTSQSPSEFRDKLIQDLSTMVKYSVIDEPIQHGVAIVADTDTWTCQLMVVSKSKRAAEGEMMTGVVPSSLTIRQMLHSVGTLWDMQLQPEFCLSHLEDCLLELNEKAKMLSNGVLENGQHSDFTTLLQQLHSSMRTHKSDRPLLHALSSVHASSYDVKMAAALQRTFLHSLVN